MNLNDFQHRAYSTAQIDWIDRRRRNVPMFGVVGELGSLLSEVKKSLRDGAAYTDLKENLAEEFGDIMWYLAALASHFNLSLVELTKGSTPVKAGNASFADMYAMVSAFAELAQRFEILPSKPTSSQKRLFGKSIGKCCRVTLQALKASRIDLNQVLNSNLAKVQGMFGHDNSGPARCFDGPGYPAFEHLPRKLPIQFLERSRGKGRIEVILRSHDLNIGDRLTDNAAIDDGYRYHDAFHFAYAAVLGWSPVTRALLRCKRKSNPQKDEIDDGARAIIVEEAIAHTVFNYALGHSMLSGLDRLDHNILKLIGTMVRNLEVRDCQPHEWQHAILTGFTAFRALTESKGGWLLLNAETRSLTFSKEGPGAI